MKIVEESRQQERRTSPNQVWMTLTALQQETVLQTVVSVCQEMVAHWTKEKNDESVSRQ